MKEKKEAKGDVNTPTEDYHILPADHFSSFQLIILSQGTIKLGKIEFI